VWHLSWCRWEHIYNIIVDVLMRGLDSLEAKRHEDEIESLQERKHEGCANKYAASALPTIHWLDNNC
jgi:hypothetical protein